MNAIESVCTNIEGRSERCLSRRALSADFSGVAFSWVCRAEVPPGNVRSVARKAMGLRLLPPVPNRACICRGFLPQVFRTSAPQEKHSAGYKFKLIRNPWFQSTVTGQSIVKVVHSRFRFHGPCSFNATCPLRDSVCGNSLGQRPAEREALRLTMSEWSDTSGEQWCATR